MPDPQTLEQLRDNLLLENKAIDPRRNPMYGGGYKRGYIDGVLDMFNGPKQGIAKVAQEVALKDTIKING